MIRSIVCIFGLCLLSLSAIADTRYISDTQYIPIRSGAGGQFRIVHKGLKSGTKLSIIEAPDDSEWSLIKTEGGTEGWIRNQYLQRSETARIKLYKASEGLTATQKKLTTAKLELKQLQSKHNQVTKSSAGTNRQYKKLSDKYNKLKALSDDAINLNVRYKGLLEDHEMLKTHFDTVNAENDRLQSDKTINQWLFGAGLVVLGMILMLILPALKPAKHDSDWVN